MPTKKAKTKSSKKKTAPKKAAPKKAAVKKATPKKKAAVKRSAGIKSKSVATAASKKTAVKKAKPAAAKKSAGGSRGPVESAELLPTPRRGLGADSGGQSGDEQGLSDVAQTDSESVTELLEEGQAYEAEAVRGVENAPDADVSEVRTHEVPEDDVPQEYLDRD
jgi:hypothetical protein